MQMYELLDLLLYSSACVSRLPLIGGDLNACIGQMFPQHDFVDVVPADGAQGTAQDHC